MAKLNALGRPWIRMRAEVLARSQVCWLCGYTIDIALPRTHRMSATVDHVIPRAVAPHLALDPSNLRPAHRACNSAKGKRQSTPSNNTRDW